MNENDNLTIEEEIALLQKRGESTSLTLGEIFQILSDKGQSLIVLFLSLPFCQPIQIPGFSTPFGIAIAFIGLKMAVGKYAFLPKSILERPISPQTLKTITEKFLWLLQKMNRWIHPRLTWLCNSPTMQVVNGIIISLLGILLALPLPVPFSNLMAAWSILFIGLGLLKDDGVFILIGYTTSLLTLGFFIAIVFFINSLF